MEKIDPTSYSAALYLGMFVTPRSPYAMPEGVWENLLGRDRNEIAARFVKGGYLEIVGQTKDGFPIYKCTDAGKKLVREYLGSDYVAVSKEVHKEMTSEQQSGFDKIAKWVLPAAVSGIIGNRSDALFVELVNQIVNQINLLIEPQKIEPQIVKPPPIILKA